MATSTAFGRPDKKVIWLAALLLGGVGVVIWDQWSQWSTREDYTFGYLVPFFCLYVLYDRWPQLKAILSGETETEGKTASVPSPSPRIWDTLVCVGLVFSLFLFGLGASMFAISGPNILATWFNTCGFIATFLGAAWLFIEHDGTGRALSFNERMTFIGLLVFPALVWFISGPFLYLVDTSIKIYLLREVTGAVVALMNGLDFNVEQQGNTILLPQLLADGQHDSVGVADACSGIRSLTACVFMGAFLSAIFIIGAVRKLVLLGLSIVFAILLNVLRTSFLTLWAFKHGSRALDFDLWGNTPKSAEFTLGTVHDIAGYVAMGITFVLLVAMLPLVNLRLTREEATLSS
ncbi:MAG: exosortase/archaeosortase family protein [Puniceicoccales bacterium]|jgi:exosortase/archaeosortase family protein|nr:exosortase/archaeosortase family protein [Puniceicoccales bacterium]